MQTLRTNCEEWGVPMFDVRDRRQGIVHIIGPEQGLTQPGMTIVCGDSHTSTHGAFGALAFGIGTSEVEHVLATQTLRQARPKTMSVEVAGRLGPGVTAKDVILGHHQSDRCQRWHRARDRVSRRSDTQPHDGRPDDDLQHVDRGGARAGLVAPDETTFAYMRGRPHAPTGEEWDRAVESWAALPSDDDATFDSAVVLDGAQLLPYVTWGTNPAQSVTVNERVPDPETLPPALRESARRALAYQDLKPGIPIREIAIDKVFLGSCTNGRIEDLRAAAKIVAGKQLAASVKAIVVPGSGLVKQQAEREGLDAVFTDAGFEWRDAGCSMCLGMNPDILLPGERCASTSNRNFEGRQGPGGRTHLVSPEMAAAAAIAGHFVDVREVL